MRSDAGARKARQAHVEAFGCDCPPCAPQYAANSRECWPKLAAELAKRMADVGNFSRQRQQREQAVPCRDSGRTDPRPPDAANRCPRTPGPPAGANPGAQRGFTLPDRLPDLPAGLKDEKVVLQRAMDGRLDLAWPQAGMEGLAEEPGPVTRPPAFRQRAGGELPETTTCPGNPISAATKSSCRCPFSTGAGRAPPGPRLCTPRPCTGSPSWR